VITLRVREDEATALHFTLSASIRLNPAAAATTYSFSFR
jgi:hypothetical protein